MARIIITAYITTCFNMKYLIKLKVTSNGLGWDVEKYKQVHKIGLEKKIAKSIKKNAHDYSLHNT